MKRALAIAVLVLHASLASGAPTRPENGAILARERVVLPADASERARKNLDGVELERVIYASDGLEVEAFLARPADSTARDLPCVIYNRGGNRDFGGLTPERAANQLAPLARRGYVVAASNYRGNGAFGAAKYPAERVCSEGDRIGGVGREEFGGADVADVLALLPMLDRIEQADPSRTGIYGWSRGGMMTYLALRATDRFKAAIVGGGLADMSSSIDSRPEMQEHVYSELIPGWEDPATRAAAIEARSAIKWPDRLAKDTPILLLHGTADWRVDPAQALAMASALQAARHPYRLVMLEGGDHGLTEHRDEVDRLVYDWLDRYVRDGATWPSLEPHGR